MFAFIWSIVKFCLKMLLIFIGLLITLYVQWEARDFRIK